MTGYDETIQQFRLIWNLVTCVQVFFRLLQLPHKDKRFHEPADIALPTSLDTQDAPEWPTSLGVLGYMARHGFAILGDGNLPLALTKR